MDSRWKDNKKNKKIISIHTLLLLLLLLIPLDNVFFNYRNYQRMENKVPLQISRHLFFLSKSARNPKFCRASALYSDRKDFLISPNYTHLYFPKTLLFES